MNPAEAETIADLVQNMIKSFFGEQKPGEAIVKIIYI